MEIIAQFINNYMHGMPWLVGLLLLHIILSTTAHIAKKDFKISEWPKFLYMWLLFMIGIVVVNGVIAVAISLSCSAILLPIANVLQALMYTIYFSYYLDNIFKHLNMMGLPIDPGLMEFVRNMADKILKTFLGGNNS